MSSSDAVSLVLVFSLVLRVFWQSLLHRCTLQCINIRTHFQAHAYRPVCLSQKSHTVQTYSNFATACTSALPAAFWTLCVDVCQQHHCSMHSVVVCIILAFLLQIIWKCCFPRAGVEFHAETWTILLTWVAPHSALPLRCHRKGLCCPSRLHKRPHTRLVSSGCHKRWCVWARKSSQ
jgi:hypothetical protein